MMPPRSEEDSVVAGGGVPSYEEVSGLSSDGTSRAPSSAVVGRSTGPIGEDESKAKGPSKEVDNVRSRKTDVYSCRRFRDIYDQSVFQGVRCALARRHLAMA